MENNNDCDHFQYRDSYKSVLQYHKSHLKNFRVKRAQLSSYGHLRQLKSTIEKDLFIKILKNLLF